MIIKREIVVVLNGPVLGLTHSFIRYLFALRRQTGQSKIALFIHTWDFEDNNVWVKALKRKVAEFSNEIELHLEVEKYNSEEAFCIQHKFQSLLGIELPYIHGYVGKRVWYFYSLLKILKTVKEYNRDAFIFRFPNDISVPFDHLGAPLVNISEILMKGISKIFNIQLLPQFYNSSPDEIFFTNSFYPYGINERAFLASITLCEKIFGKNFDLNNFFIDHSKIYLEYLKNSKIKIDFSTIAGINRVFTDYDIIPNEAAHYLYILISRIKPEVPVIELGELNRNMIPLNSFSNPWYHVYKRKIEYLVPIMKYRAVDDHIFSVNPEHTVYGKDN